jgi:sugar phosphate isomerase/epimerase
MGSAAGLALAGCLPLPREAAPPLFGIGLCQWAYHVAHFSGELEALAFPELALQRHGVTALDWTSRLFLRAGDPTPVSPDDHAFFRALRARCDALGMRSLVVLVDLGDDVPPLGATSPDARERALEAAARWVEPVRILGGSGFRVNAHSDAFGPDAAERALDACSEGLDRLLTATRGAGVEVLVENHGGFSSRGDWLAALMQRLSGHSHTGVLADFGNWTQNRLTPEIREAIGKRMRETGRFDLGVAREVMASVEFEAYPPLQGMREIAPFARAVSAKAHAFDADGNETRIDFAAMLRILLDAGFHGWVTAEYEGQADPAVGTDRTLALLQRVRDELGHI